MNFNIPKYHLRHPNINSTHTVASTTFVSRTKVMYSIILAVVMPLTVSLVPGGDGVGSVVPYMMVGSVIEQVILREGGLRIPCGGCSRFVPRGLRAGRVIWLSAWAGSGSC